MNEKKPKKRALSRDYLVRATYNYLQRFATTEKNLALVLDRKVRRRLPESDGQELYSQAKGWIEDIVQKAVQQNLVNDRQFAEARARSLTRGGNSKRNIAQKLQAKGVAADMVDEVMQNLSEQYEDMDFFAAVKYARKRRFGSFSTRHDGQELVEKELASMCRAGFSYTLAGKILKMTHDELEDMLYQKD
ncbi:MAG: RecX family transcriptional regulator [Emcibacter sp.]|nr:RecX family transcriptional regulator [Emcibacter sp.]